MTYWETEERYDTPGKRIAELERELRHERDEYAKLWQMYGDLEDERDRLREAIRSAEQFREDYLTQQVDGFGDPPKEVRAYCNGMSIIIGMINDEIKRAALQEACDE